MSVLRMLYSERVAKKGPREVVKETVEDDPPTITLHPDSSLWIIVWRENHRFEKGHEQKQRWKGNKLSNLPAFYGAKK